MATEAKTDSAQPVTVVIQQNDRAADAAAAMVEAHELAMDTTRDGGDYIVGGVHVDANGEPLKKSDKDS